MKIPEQAVKVFMNGFWGDASVFVEPSHVKDALTAAAPYMSGVKVKKLEWNEYDNERGTPVRWDAEASNFGVFYSIVTQHDGYRVVFDYEAVGAIGVLDNPESAKAAAQADYENRILSALEPSSARDQALEEASNVVNSDIIKELEDAIAWRKLPGKENHKATLGILERALSAILAFNANLPPRASLDLSNILRHAFISGFEAKGGTITDAINDWPDYNPEKCSAYERIIRALKPQQNTETSAIEKKKFYHNEWPHDALMAARRDGFIDHNGGEAWRYQFTHKDEKGKYDLLYRDTSNSSIQAALPPAQTGGGDE